MAKVNTKPLGISDFLICIIVFSLICLGLYRVLSTAVPGLLSESAMKQMMASGFLFLAFWVVLGNSVFQKYFELLFERERRTTGALAQAQESVQELSSIEDQIETQLRAARLEGIEKRDALIAAAKKQAVEIEAQAQGVAQSELDKANALIEVLKNKAEEELQVEAGKLATLVIERTLSSAKQTVH